MTLKGILEQRKLASELATARKYAVALITGAFGIGLFISEIQRIWKLPHCFFSWAYIALFVLVGLLVFVWIWATQKELDLLLEWLEPKSYVPPSSMKETAMIVGEGVVLTALFFTARDPCVFSIVFTAYSLLVMVSVMHLNRELRLAFADTEEHLAKTTESERNPLVGLQLEGLGVLCEYFLGRPHTLRHIVILLVSVLGVGLSAWWWLSDAQALGIASYSLFFTLILVSEVVIAQWRNYRDAKLRIVISKMHKVQYDLLQDRESATSPSTPVS